jgi:hypothetical protein
MDEWTPRREEQVDDDWVERELDRLQEEEARFRQPPVVEVVNGATREAHGPFGMLPERVFRTDGRAELSSAKIEELLHRLMAEARRSGSVAPVLALRAARSMRRLCDELEYEAVAIARACGWPWRDVGAALGISESGAHRRFARDGAKPRQRRIRM